VYSASVVYWSEFLTTDPEVRVRFPVLPEKKVVGLERGPLSLVSTTEELLERPLDVRPLDSFPEFHGTRRFNTEFTTALHLLLSDRWAI
jgi:hypothetical protein